MRQIILDVETTGLSPEKGHRIIELCALEMIDNKLTGEKLHLFFNPEREIDADATRVHGYKLADLQDKPVFKEHIQDVFDFLKESIVIAHNAKFDISFLLNEFTLAGMLELSPKIMGVECTMLSAHKRYGKRLSLNNLCDMYKINRANRIKHSALLDCELLAKVYVELLRRLVTYQPIEATSVKKKQKKCSNYKSLKEKL